MAKTDNVTFLSLESIYTPLGLRESLKWLLGTINCPFNNPQKAEIATLRILKAKYGISSKADLLRKGPDIIEAILNGLDLQVEIQESDDFDSSSFVPPQWLMSHWQRQAEESQLKEAEIRDFMRLQNTAWISLIKERSASVSSEELSRAYREESDKVLSLFQRGVSKIEKNATEIEKEVESLVRESLPGVKGKEIKQIAGKVLEEMNTGVSISAETLPSFKKDVERIILSSAQALGANTEEFEEKFRVASEAMIVPTFEKVSESRRTARDIDNTIKRTTTTIPQETTVGISTPQTTMSPTEQMVIPQRLYRLPALEWVRSENSEKGKINVGETFKRIGITPITKPLQTLVALSPDRFLAANPGLYYKANYGINSEDVQGLIEKTQKTGTKTQISFLRGLKSNLSLFEQNHPIFSSIFSNYFKAKKNGKEIGFAKSKGGLFSLKAKFLGSFKKTSFGKWIGKGASKLLIKLGLGSLTAGWGSLALGTKKFLKKLVAAAGLGYLGLLTAAAMKGAGALIGTVAGGIGGVIGGAVLGAKLGASIGVLGGPVGAIAGGAIGLIVGGVAGFFAGSWIEGLIAKSSGLSVAGTTSSIMSNSTAAVASSLPTVVPAAVVGTLAVTIIISQITSAAFIVPYSDRISPWQGQSKSIKVEKSITFDPGDGSPIELNPEEIENSELNSNARFIYQISITAVGSKLLNVKVNDVLTSTQESGNKKIESFSFNSNEDIEAGETLVLDQYEVPAWPAEDFIDSILSNTAIVEATIENTGEEEKSFKSTVLIIGNPPQDCPRGWPISQPFYITQGPGGSFSHNISGSSEATDMSYQGGIFGRKVSPTHKGILYTGNDEVYGRYISVTGTCRTASGKMTAIVSLYAHLSEIYIESDTQVDPSIIIGAVGNSGASTGPHLHYEFRSANNEIRMEQPYTPIDVPRGDICSSTNHCPSE